MIDRVKKEIDWPGRPVQPDPEQVDEEEGPEDESPGESSFALIDPEREGDLRDRIERAEKSRQRLEDEASKMLDENVDFETDDLPQTEEAARMMGGTHPSFGNQYPEPPEDRQLADGKVTGEHFRRAYKTMENADRNAFGFSMQEAVTTTGGVRPFKTIDSPSKAAGVVNPGREGETTMSGAAEQNEKEQRLSMGKKAAKMIGGFLLKWVAKLVESVGDAFKGALNIGIGPYSIGIGSLIAKPYYLFADWLNGIAEDLMNEALGQDPSQEEPEGEDADVPDGNDAASSDGESQASVEDPNPASGLDRDFGGLTEESPEAIADVAPSGGPDFLMAAHRVVRSSVLKANREGGDMKEAIGLYDTARDLKRDLDAHKEMAEAWGVDGAAPDYSIEKPDRPASNATTEEDELEC